MGLVKMSTWWKPTSWNNRVSKQDCEDCLTPSLDMGNRPGKGWWWPHVTYLVTGWLRTRIQVFCCIVGSLSRTLVVLAAFSVGFILWLRATASEMMKAMQAARKKLRTWGLKPPTSMRSWSSVQDIVCRWIIHTHTHTHTHTHSQSFEIMAMYHTVFGWKHISDLLSNSHDMKFSIMH